jgi:hypothetical protein
MEVTPGEIAGEIGKKEWPDSRPITPGRLEAKFEGSSFGDDTPEAYQAAILLHLLLLDH